MSDKQILLNHKKYKGLAEYLDRHEVDISIDIDDYGDLWDLYVAVFDRRPMNKQVNTGDRE